VSVIIGLVALLALAVQGLAAKAGASSSSSSSTTGVTKSTINIAYIYNDLSILTQEHLAPSDGNVLADVQDIVSYLNDHGGVGGRQIRLSVYKMPSLTGSAATDNAACLTTTEQDHAFFVYIANAVDPSVAQCTAAKHKTLTFLTGGASTQYFQQAQGRLFMIGSGVAMDAERNARGWAQIMAQNGALKGKKIGVISEGIPEITNQISHQLKPELAKYGYKIAAEATVPFPAGATNCDQTSTAAQVMKQVGVNMVFLAAYDLCGVAVVTAAQSLDYKPQWTTDSDNITDTVAHYFSPVKQEFNGAFGVSSGSGVLPYSQPAIDCVNKMINPAQHYENGTDAFGIAAQTCVAFQQIALALNKTPSNMSAPAVISQMQTQTVQPMSYGPFGSLGPSQHDAANYLYEVQYSAGQSKFHLVSPHPVKVPCPCAP
jgi:hypothetical protein